ADAEAFLSDLGSDYYFGAFGLIAGDLERCLGRFERAEQLLRRADTIFERAGERSVRSTALAQLAHTLLAQGRFDDADQTALAALELGSSDDTGTVSVASAVLARTGARRGEAAAAERSARAVALIEETDMLWLQGELRALHAKVLLALGRAHEAQHAMREAIA